MAQEAADLLCFRLRPPSRVRLAPSDPGLARGGGDAGGDAQAQERPRSHSRPMAGRELACAIAEAVGTRAHRQAAEMALDVVSQRLGGSVAARRLLAQCREHDDVEISAQSSRQASPLGAITERRASSIAVVLDDRNTRRVGVLLAHQPFELAPPGVEWKRMTTGEQLVEHHAQRVDVGRGGDRLAADLLGAGVVRASAARTPVRV